MIPAKTSAVKAAPAKSPAKAPAKPATKARRGYKTPATKAAVTKVSAPASPRSRKASAS